MIKLVATVGKETSVAYIDNDDVEAVAQKFTEQFEADWPSKLAGSTFTFSLIGEPAQAAGNWKAPKTHKVQAHVTGLNFGAKYRYVLPYLKPGRDIVVLYPEPDNEVHENAVRVELCDGEKLGYLAWSDADRFHKGIKAGQYAQIASVDTCRPGGMVIEFEVPYNL